MLIFRYFVSCLNAKEKMVFFLLFKYTCKYFATYFKIMNQIDLQFSLDSHYIYNVGHMVISFEPR